MRSKYQYEVELNQKQRFDIVLHQEDIRILDVIRRRPYMSIGISVFKQDPQSGKLDFITATVLGNQR